MILGYWKNDSEFSKMIHFHNLINFILLVGQHTLKALSTLKNLHDNSDESYKFANKIIKQVKTKTHLFFCGTSS